MTALIKYPFTNNNESLITDILINNQVLSFPTETVYGLGGNAFSKEVTDRIYLIKQRSRNKPFPLLITLRWLKILCHWNDPRIDDLIKAFWPGPLTLILKINPDLPTHLKNNSGALAVRYSSSTLVQSLIELGECPLIGTSANRSGFPVCTSADEVISNFKDDVDIVIDGYNRSDNAASTIVNCITEPFKILRQGATAFKELNHICEIKK
tara:strand:+ start:205 stop:834 length:630 start_codon:yes stop_codon:yes gene_type:complete